MTSIPAIKQLEERNVASEIVLMVWSDRMDLVALANIKGEVTLQRLTWTKAWTLPPPKDNLKVKSLVWRPDGKIIAIAYISGQIILVKVENKNILHTIELTSEIRCLSWLQDRDFLKKKSLDCEDNQQNEYYKTIDFSSKFLLEPQSHQFDSDETSETNILQDQNDLNLLVVGTTDSTIFLYIFGCFLCASIDLKQHIEGTCIIDNVHLDVKLDKMYISIRDSNQQVRLLTYNCDIFHTHVNELYAIALKYIKLNSLINYLNDTINTITESWESILLEMDMKLSKYAKRVPPGGVTADFLELLMFGICSDDMKSFLIYDLTKKGLEKFGQTIEMSYTNIQKLLIKYIMKFGQNVSYHLTELRGMARLEFRYEILGLQESVITDALHANGSFLIKSGEMQQIINYSIINYKAFFRWLYTAIVQILEEPIPSEIPKMTQQDLAYIAEFIQNFDRIGGDSSNGFTMDRLGQYLNDSPLTFETNMASNEWCQFLAQNQCLQKHVFKHYSQMSLIQQFKLLKEKLDLIFIEPRKSLNQQFQLINDMCLFQTSQDNLKVTVMNIDKQSSIFSYFRNCNKIQLVVVSDDIKSICLNCQTSDTNLIDVKLYTSIILTVLLKIKNKSVLCQVPIGRVYEEGVTELDLFDLQPQFAQNVEGMIGAEFAVSGCRKVGIVLAESRRKVRLYEMEGEEEEEEDAEMDTTVKD